MVLVENGYSTFRVHGKIELFARFKDFRGIQISDAMNVASRFAFKDVAVLANLAAFGNRFNFSEKYISLPILFHVLLL